MLTYRENSKARRRGLDLVISLTEDQADAIGVDAAELAEALDTLLVGLAALRTGRDPLIPDGAGMSLKDAPCSASQVWDEWLIRDTTVLVERATGVMDAAIRTHAAHGGSYGSLTAAMGLPRSKRSTAQRRRDSITGGRPDEGEMWARGGEYTHPSVYAGIAAGASWADPEMDPTRIDWTERQARAAIPFRVVDGRPVAPAPPTGVRYGRNELGHWGEQQCADALVTATCPDGHRWIVMVERSDGHGWALPGGYVDPGEEVGRTAVRELAEETGLDLTARDWTTDAPRYVPDPRASDEAWMVTTLTRFHLGQVEQLPTVRGLDDARRAEWVRADSYSDLTSYLTTTCDGRVFDSHQQMLADVLR